MSVQQYLERLFTWESLQNTTRGVEFELKNRLIEGELHEIGNVTLDDETVDPEDITLELSNGTLVEAATVSADDPVPFDLAETVQVIIDAPRLRKGTHTLGMEMDIEGFGMVGFETDDDVTEADLVDVDPAEYTVAELEDLVDELREPVELERLLEREREGKARKTAIEAIEDRLEVAREEAPDEEEIEYTAENADPGGSLVEELLVDILESPQRVTVYLTAFRQQPTTPGAIASQTLFTEEAVEETLGDFEMEGIAERNGDEEYEVVSPVTVIRKRQNRLWNLLSRGL
ncbi:hypothetical protein [Haloglomus halophilum]|uniref:hypothetical protein n=1 Tax=Haloglomus halophilum TaxID=2962672 RepID=UPI0020C947AE|nr:hypothetical protein [Haloglomus halophilum]